MGSLFAAISGLQASSRWLDVISNNVSNTNTVAFKRGRANFTDMISQGLVSASAADAGNNLGGINPAQLGLGVTVSSVQNIFSQGALQTTGNALDIAIQGNGFFTLKQGSNTYFTRAGNFTFDGQGNLVNQSGGLVQGWSRGIEVLGTVPTVSSVTSFLNTGTLAGNIQIPQTLVLAPMATSNESDTAVKDKGVILHGNLDDRTPQNLTALPLLSPGVSPTDASLLNFVPDVTTEFTVYDSLGTPHEITLLWQQVAATQIPTNAAAQWQYFAFETTGGIRPTGSGALNGSASNYLGGTTHLSPDITFNGDGSLATNGLGVLDRSGAIPPAATNLYPGPAVNPTLTIPSTNGSISPFTFSLNFGTPNVSPVPPVAGVTPSLGLRDGITGDYGSGFTDTATGQYLPHSTLRATVADGYAEGFLVDVFVDTSGGIQASFSNLQTITMAKLEISRFSNPEGLQKVGGSDFIQTSNSGSPMTGEAGQDGFGTTIGRALEMSNVDLASELTNMMLAQRMFESDAKVVSVSDEALKTANDMVQR